MPIGSISRAKACAGPNPEKLDIERERNDNNHSQQDPGLTGATSSRNRGRNHLGMKGRLRRNRQPLLAAAGRRAQVTLEERGLVGPHAVAEEGEEYTDHVIIAGFGLVCRTIARMLDALDQRWIANDTDAAIVAEAHGQGLPVFFGDAGQEAVLQAVGVERARAAVITTDDTNAAVAVIARLRWRLPDLPIVARARSRSYARPHDRRRDERDAGDNGSKSASWQCCVANARDGRGSRRQCDRAVPAGCLCTAPGHHRSRGWLLHEEAWSDRAEPNRTLEPLRRASASSRHAS